MFLCFSSLSPPFPLKPSSLILQCVYAYSNQVWLTTPALGGTWAGLFLTLGVKYVFPRSVVSAWGSSAAWDGEIRAASACLPVGIDAGAFVRLDHSWCNREKWNVCLCPDLWRLLTCTASGVFVRNNDNNDNSETTLSSLHLSSGFSWWQPSHWYTSYAVGQQTGMHSWD